MSCDTPASHPAGVPAGWARWPTLAVFAALIGVGLLRLRPSPAAAGVAAAAAIGAAAVVIWQRGRLGVRQSRYLLPLAAIATAGVAVVGDGSSANVGWFAVCPLGIWSALYGKRWEYLAYLGGTLILFTIEWLWIHADTGWGAWMAGTTLAVAAGGLLPHERGPTARLGGAPGRAAAPGQARGGQPIPPPPPR